ncbi:hypothetical protein ZIOFF_051816 [Zingiber officinale]|uniref:Mitochondrial protein n=1 Tax=Zingiber officinale TaxID=94328 RepID=A0A8J5KUX7_ZINOF|nr:hypothetical protein ZIOFF_051816 [Zingiber officinale]
MWNQAIKHYEGEKVDPTFFKSLVGSLRYLMCTRPDIFYVVGLVSSYMEAPTISHLKIAKRILRYIKGTTDFGLLYSTSNHLKLEGYSDSDCSKDMDDIKNTTGFMFFMGDTVFTWILYLAPLSSFRLPRYSMGEAKDNDVYEKELLDYEEEEEKAPDSVAAKVSGEAVKK